MFSVVQIVGLKICCVDYNSYLQSGGWCSM